MNEQIMRAGGFGPEVDKVKAGQCPICGRKVDVAAFRDALSLKEFGISGMCQACQDALFGE
jgi:hypothetical protein